MRAGGAGRRGVSPGAGVAGALDNIFSAPRLRLVRVRPGSPREKGGPLSGQARQRARETGTGEVPSHGQGWCRGDSRKDRYMKRSRAFTLTAVAVVALATSLLSVPAAFGASPGAGKLSLDDPVCASGVSLCADVHGTLNGYYVGHDEPSLLFKSNVPGSGNNLTYLMTLPKDPTAQPTAFGGLETARHGTSSFVQHSGSASRCATRSRPPSSRRPVSRTPTRTTSSAPTRRLPTTSASTPVTRSWSCSSTRRVTWSSSKASAAPPPSTARR